MSSLKKIVEIVIGNRATIERGSYSGIFTGFPVTLLIVIYFAFTQEIDLFEFLLQDLDFWNIYSGVHVLMCLSLGFIVLGGRAIGWLLIRPLATVICEIFPDTEYTSIWAWSSAVIWIPIVLLITQPFEYQAGILKWVFFVVIVFQTLVFSVWGGKSGARVAIGPSKDYRELIVTGGTVTGGSLLIGLQVLVSVFSIGGSSSSPLASTVLAFCIALALLSFLCMFPYILIVPLSSTISRVGVFQNHLLLAFSLTSAACWSLIALFFFRISENVNLLGGLSFVIVIGLCGASGGWAVGQFKQEVVTAAS